MNQNELQNNTTEINDLTVTDAEQSEIKGGPKKIFIGGLSALDNETTLPNSLRKGEVIGKAIAGD